MPGVVVEAFADVGEGVQLAFHDDCGVLAVLFDEGRFVRYDDHGFVPALLEKLCLALIAEARVPHRHHFIDEVTVKVDHHGESESKSSTHARGIKPHRLPHVFAQFGKVFHVVKFVFERDVIYTADEAEVIEAGQMTLKSAGKSQRPRDAHVAPDETFGGRLDPADEAHQRRFAASVAAENANPLAAVNREVDPVKNGVLAAVERISLGDVVNEDQGVAGGGFKGLRDQRTGERRMNGG